MAKYRVGDEVTVRAVIAAEFHDGRVYLEFPESKGTSSGTTVNAMLTTKSIATHTPKPREFEPGDMVTWGDGDETLEFIAERYGYAIMWSKEYERSACQPLSRIRHADEDGE